MNIVVLSGNLSKDPKLTKTTSGISVLNCTIAVNRDYKDKDGNPFEGMDFAFYTSFKAYDKTQENKKGKKNIELAPITPLTKGE